MAASLTWRGVLFAGGLSAVAGYVDAVGYLRLGGYFVSFMSGNSTRASADLVRGSVIGAALALGLVAFFVLGVVISSLIFRTVRDRRRLYVLSLSAFLLIVATVVPDLGAAWVFPPVLAMAMGVMNTTYTKGGEVSVGVTYMTGTLVKTGQAFAAALTGDRHQPWLKYLTMWAMITVGAVIGAIGYRFIGLHALWVATAATIVWAFLAARRVRIR